MLTEEAGFSDPSLLENLQSSHVSAPLVASSHALSSTDLTVSLAHSALWIASPYAT